MGVLSETGVFILNTAYFLFSIAIVARFLAQIARADFYNPLAQTVIKITNPFLVPMRKVIPGFGGLDIASLVLLYVSHVIYTLLTIIMLGGNPLDMLVSTSIFSLIASAGIILNVIWGGMIIIMIASWMGGGNAMINFINQIVDPFLGPFRKLNLQVGMLDLSFMVAAMTIYIIKNIFIGAITVQLAGQLQVGGWIKTLVGL